MTGPLAAGRFRCENASVHFRFLEHAGRAEAYAELLNAHADSSGPHPRPRMITVAGRPGIGKTRIVQEMYRTLARDQTYWPPDLIDRDGPPLSAQRKRIAPRARIRVGTGGPPFLWFGVTCERDRDDLADLRYGLREHLPSAFLSKDDHSQLLGTAVTDDLLATSVTEGAKALADASLLGVGSVISLIRRGMAWRGEQAAVVESRALQTQERDVNPAMARATDALLHLVRAAQSATDLRVVLVIEDAHLASPDLLDLLAALLGPEAPVPRLVVIALADDTTLDHQEASAAAAFGRLSRVLTEDGRASRIDLAPFSPAELSELVTSEAAKTRPDLAEALAKQAEGNPFVLRLMLETRRVQDARSGDAYRLSGKAISELPTNVLAALTALWNELSYEQRDALAIASLQGRAFIERLAEATDALRPRGDVRWELRQAREATGWTRTINDDLSAFVEAHNFGLARRHLEAAWPTDARAAAVVQLYDLLVDATSTPASPIAWRSRLRVLVELATQRIGFDETFDVAPALKAAGTLFAASPDRQIAESVTRLARASTAIDVLHEVIVMRVAESFPGLVLELTLGAVPASSPAGAFMRACALPADKAIPVLRELSALVSDELAAHRVRHVLVTSLLSAGEIQEATELVEQKVFGSGNQAAALVFAELFGRAGVPETSHRLLEEAGSLGWLALALKLARGGDLDRALALAPRDKSYSTLLDRARVYAAAGDADAAQRELLAAEDTGEAEPGTLALRRFEVADLLGSDDVGELAVALVRDSPEEVEAVESFGGWPLTEGILMAAHRCARFDELLSSLDKLAQLPGMVDPLYAAASKLAGTEPHAALAVVEALVQQTPERTEAQVQHADLVQLAVLQKDDRWDDALVLIDRLLEQGLTDRTALRVRRVGVLRMANRPQQALDLAEELLRDDELHSRIAGRLHLESARAYAALEAWHDALTASRHDAVRLNLRYASGGWAIEARAHAARGDSELAGRALQQARALAFTHHDATSIGIAHDDLQVLRMTQLLQAIFTQEPD